MNQWWHDKQAKKPAAAVVTSAPNDGSGGDGPGSGAVTAPVPAATVLPVAPMMDGAAGIIAPVASGAPMDGAPVDGAALVVPAAVDGAPTDSAAPTGLAPVDGAPVDGAPVVSDAAPSLFYPLHGSPLDDGAGNPYDASGGLKTK